MSLFTVNDLANGIISVISIYRYMLFGINVACHYYTYIMFKIMQISQYGTITASCCTTILMYYDMYFCNFCVYKYKALSTLMSKFSHFYSITDFN